jgi:hypothetical protein
MTQGSFKIVTQTLQPELNSTYVSIQGNPNFKKMGLSEIRGSNKALRSRRSFTKDAVPIMLDLKRKPGAIKIETEFSLSGRNPDSAKSVQTLTKLTDHKIRQNQLRFSTRTVAPVNPERKFYRPKSDTPPLQSDMLSKVGPNLQKSNFEPTDLLSKIEKQENLVIYHLAEMPQHREKSKPSSDKTHKKSRKFSDVDKYAGDIPSEPVQCSGLDTPGDLLPERLEVIPYN